jgi:hypothetical protein
MPGLAEVAVIGVVIAVASVPPALGWIPRNRIYGFRVPATLRTDAVWYAINRRFGYELIGVGASLALLSISLEATGFDTPGGRAIAVSMMIATLLTTTVRGWRAANRMERTPDQHPRST